MILSEIKSNGVVIIYDIFYARRDNDRKEQANPFNEIIVKSIEEGNAVAATDASVKDGKMGGCWIIVNKENRDLLSNELHHKRWEHNTSGSAEVIVLLEMLVTLKRGINR